MLEETSLLLFETQRKMISSNPRGQQTPTDEAEADFINSIQHTANPDVSSLPDRSQGTIHLTESEEILPAGIGQYDDFHTIDWQRDLARDRKRHRYGFEYYNRLF